LPLLLLRFLCQLLVPEFQHPLLYLPHATWLLQLCLQLVLPYQMSTETISDNQMHLGPPNKVKKKSVAKKKPQVKVGTEKKVVDTPALAPEPTQVHSFVTMLTLFSYYTLKYIIFVTHDSPVITCNYVL
jgi:hypothetical protein